MNVLSEFYQELGDRLQSIVDNSEQPIIKHIDMWNQQHNSDWKEPFHFPAVFLEFKTIPWQTTGKHKQLGTLQFDLHISSTTKAKSSMKSHNIDTWLEHLELLDIIHYWITAWHGDFFSSVNRIGTTPDHYYGDVISHIQSYRCTIVDESAMRSFTKLEGDKLVITFPLDE